MTFCNNSSLVVMVCLMVSTVLLAHVRPAASSAWMPSSSDRTSRSVVTPLIRPSCGFSRNSNPSFGCSPLARSDDQNQDLDTDGMKLYYDGSSTIALRRRDVFIKSALGLVVGASLMLQPGASMAEADTTSTSNLFMRKTDQFAYEFQPPPTFEMAGKPLKTHLDEVIFKSSTAGYQFGITIDPVRINSLQQFGTAEEVAAKVVLAEVNRDGVFDVTLMQDAFADKNNNYYQLNYQSKGKRGTKRFVAKFYVSKQKLYALTAQCKEADYPQVERELLQAVDSFRLVE